MIWLLTIEQATIDAYYAPVGMLRLFHRDTQRQHSQGQFTLTILKFCCPQ